jgi:hypothetical protein
MNDETPEAARPSLRTRPAAAAPEPKKSLYVVKGADIWSSAGRHAEGSTVELTPAEARHFTKAGLLAPYIPGEEHEG